MKIKTKFKIGKTIWCISNDEKWKIIDYGVIFRICADIYKKATYIDYEIDKPYSNSFSEQDCFATKEQAQKECDKRNGNKRTEN